MDHHQMHGGQEPAMDMTTMPMPTESDSMAGGGHGGHMNEFLDGWGENQQELLGMLHVPLLHGGIKEVLLLETLSTSSSGSFTLACFVLALCTFLLEVLRLASWWVENKRISKPRAKSACECKHCTGVTVSLRGVTEGKSYNAIHDSNSAESLSVHSTGAPARKWISFWYFLLSILDLLVYLTSTLLMLIAMTMNIYLILSMAIGASLGKIAMLFARQKIESCAK